MTQPSQFIQAAFTSQPEDVKIISDKILVYAQKTENPRILDIGCGDGGVLRETAQKRGQGKFTGIDVSSSNIESAREASLHEDRFEFICGDYREFQGGPFDVIGSFSTLQHLETGDDALLKKISGSLVKNGFFIYSMPTDCFYNRTLYGFRKILIRFRGPRLDRLLLAMARAWHGKKSDAGLLKQRVLYLYTLPQRLDGEIFREKCRASGLEKIAEYPQTHKSPGQPKHTLVVFQKKEAA